MADSTLDVQPQIDAPTAGAAPAEAPSPTGMLSGVSAPMLQKRRAEGGEASGGSEMDIARSGFSGEAGPLPHGGMMRSGFGEAAVSPIKAYTDESAAAAAKGVGAQAYAVGNQIAFAEKNPSPEIVAHEVAHTIQQSGGNAVQKMSNATPDNLEREADAAAATVVAGGKADISMTTGSGGIHKWGGSDHHALGELGGQKAIKKFKSQFPQLAGTGSVTHGDPSKASGVTDGADGKATGGMTTKDNEDTLRIGTGEKKSFFGKSEGKTSVSFGDASRFSGDYTEDVKDLKGKTSKDLNDPGKLVGAAHSAQMVWGATTNANHFYPTNRFEYAGHHQKALQAAAAHDLDTAMQEEGFASHFLQDTFSSGHMAPRSLDSVEQMHNDTKTKQTLGLLAGGKQYLKEGWNKVSSFGGEAYDGLMKSKTWHDFFCALPNGLPTDQGRFHGDYYMDGHDLEYVSDMVSNSIQEVLSVAAGKPMHLGITPPTPSFGQIMADPIAGPAWKLMLGEYKAELAEAEKEIKQGDKGKTDGGTQYDSSEALGLMEKNIFGKGADLPAQPGQNLTDPVAKAAAKANQGRKDFSGALFGIKHYCSATFGYNVTLGLDDDGKQAKGGPNWELGNQMGEGKVGGIEEKFHMISSAGDYLMKYIGDLDEYSGALSNVKGDISAAKKELDHQKAVAASLKPIIANWKALADASKQSMMGTLGSKMHVSDHTKNSQQAQQTIATQVASELDLVNSLGDLPDHVANDHAAKPVAGSA